MEKLLVGMNLARWYLPLNKNLPNMTEQDKNKAPNLLVVWSFYFISE